MIRRYLGLAPDERRRFRGALAALAAARVAIAVLPFRAVRAALRRIPASSSAAPSPGPAAVRRAVARAARVLPGSTCLARSLAAAALLRRAGLPAPVVLGAARDRDGGLRAHAWVGGGPGGEGFAVLGVL